MKSRSLAYILVIAALLAVFVAPAGAHANLLTANPEPEAQLDTYPAQIELIFSEPLEPAFSNIQVLDGSGNQVDAGDSTVDPADPTRLTVSMRSVGDGIYTVVWRTLSTVDGHVTAGVYPFSIGDVDAAALAAAAEASQQVRLPVGEVLARWLQYGGVAVLTGGLLFLLIVWQPTIAETKNSIDEIHWKAYLKWAVTIALLANVGFILVQAGEALGGSFAAPWNPAVGNLLVNTRSGALWLSRVILILAFAAVALPSASDRHYWVAFGIAAAVTLAISIGSHASAEPQPVLPVLADFIHNLAASVWVGGLAFFIIGLAALRKRDDEVQTKTLSRLIPRFSRIGLATVGAISLTGVYSAYLRIGTLENLTQGVYGQSVIAKSALLLPMVVLGALNLLWYTPRLRKAAQGNTGEPTLASRFAKGVRLEVVLATAILALVGLLTSLPPAQDASDQAAISEAQTAEDLDLVLEVSPGQVGMNTYAVYVEQDGRPLEGLKEVSLKFSATTSDIPESDVTLEEQGEGWYSLRGAYFGVPDVWQVQVAVRRTDSFDVFANYSLAIGVAPSSTFPWYQYTAVGVGLLAVVFFLMWWRLEPNPLPKPKVWGGVLTAGMIAVGAMAYAAPPGGGVTILPVNPIAPNAESVAEGEGYYKESCLMCHGVTGRGDGPVGISLSPRPADLRLHSTPGVHPDGQLFDWIANGFPNSVMPAWKETYTEEQMWHIVNYIRTFSWEQNTP